MDLSALFLAVSPLRVLMGIRHPAEPRAWAG